MAFQNRKTTRLENYDYSADGAYFITICTKDKRCILGSCVGGGVLDAPQMQLSEAGKIVEKHLNELNRTYSDVQITKFVIMPNHIHMILTISAHSGTSRTPSPTNAIVPRTISTLKRFIHKSHGEPLFQRGYHDHIIRCEDDYRRIWEYIDTNPQKWTSDQYYPTP